MANPPQPQGPSFQDLVNQVTQQINNNPDQADAQAFGVPSSLEGVQVRTGFDYGQPSAGTQQSNYAPGTAGPFLPAGQPVQTSVSFLDAMRELANLPPDQLQGIQRQMYDAGMYPDSYYNKGGPQIHFGSLDDGTISAYKTAAVSAYRSNGQFSIKDVISRDAAAGYGKQAQASGTAPPPLVIQLTNADNIKAASTAVAQKVVGRKLSPQEMQWFVDSFHAMEATAQQQEWQMKYGNEGLDTATGTPRGPGGVLNAPPSLDANYLEYMLRQNDPQEANAQDTHAALGVAASLLGGGKL